MTPFEKHIVTITAALNAQDVDAAIMAFHSFGEFLDLNKSDLTPAPQINLEITAQSAKFYSNIATSIFFSYTLHLDNLETRAQLYNGFVKFDSVLNKDLKAKAPAHKRIDDTHYKKNIDKFCQNKQEEKNTERLKVREKEFQNEAEKHSLKIKMNSIAEIFEKLSKSNVSEETKGILINMSREIRKTGEEYKNNKSIDLNVLHKKYAEALEKGDNKLLKIKQDNIIVRKARELIVNTLEHLLPAKNNVINNPILKTFIYGAEFIKMKLEYKENNQKAVDNFLHAKSLVKSKDCEQENKESPILNSRHTTEIIAPEVSSSKPALLLKG